MIKLRILIVDDEPGMRLGTQKALKKYTLKLAEIDDEICFDTDTAETAEEALNKIKEQKPDILLLDYKLPGMSGLDLLNKIKADRTDTSTIMITAYASLETAVTAIKEGAFDFIAKPFTPQELKSTVAKAVKNLILARQVKKLNQERREIRFQFISVLGHELKAPINAVQGYLYLMKDKTLGNDIESYMTMINRCLIRTDGMMKLILDLLDLTKIESGKRERNLSRQDITQIAEQAVETAYVSAAERNIKIELHKKDPVFLNCDEGEIEIILNNLISNAVKYNRDNGRVDIYISEDDSSIKISVSDTGIGIKKNEMANLFNEFVRIKNNSTKDIPGSGLGLAIVKKIISLYKGTISVESEPNKGSTFHLTLKKNIVNQKEIL